MNPRIAFRVDATSAMGHGHLKRCLALALALRERGAEIAFVGRYAAGTAADILGAQGIAWRSVPAGDAGPEADAAVCVGLLPWTPDVVVVDHYALDRRWHTEMRAATAARIVAIDDLADRALAPDLLIDPNPADDHTAKYAAVLNAGVPICGGPAYALLDAVYARHTGAPWHESVQTIGLFFGGTDPANHTAWVLRLLRQQLGWTGSLRIASTSGNAQLAALRTKAAIYGAELLLDQPDLADFHASCDLQIGAGGGALWERCRLGVPTIALICADNQRSSVPYADAAGAVLGLDAMGQSDAQAAALLQALRTLIAEPAKRLALRECAQVLVDGQGAPRAAERVWALLPATIESVPLQLRPATLEDAELLLSWRNDEQTRAASHSAAAVALPDHLQWLRRSLCDPQRQLWIAHRGTQPVGTVRADHDAAAGHTTLSWTVAPGQRGSGVGRAMVQRATQQLSGPLHAEVKAGNTASLRIAQAAGFSLLRREGETLHYGRRA